MPAWVIYVFGAWWIAFGAGLICLQAAVFSPGHHRHLARMAESAARIEAIEKHTAKIIADCEARYGKEACHR